MGTSVLSLSPSILAKFCRTKAALPDLFHGYAKPYFSPGIDNEIQPGAVCATRTSWFVAVRLSYPISRQVYSRVSKVWLPADNQPVNSRRLLAGTIDPANCVRTFYLLIVCVVMAGCIASNRVQIDSPELAKPDFEAACAFSWPDSIAEFRLPNQGIQNPGWAYYSQGDSWLETDEQRLGQWLGTQIAKDLSHCTPDSDSLGPTELVVHYANYELPTGGRVVLDVLTVIATAGTAPVDESEGYLLCLEVKSGGHEVNHALATGRIKVNMNQFGMGKQDAAGHQAVTHMLQSLAITAWQSLWVDTPHAGTREADCPAEIAALEQSIPLLLTRAEWEARRQARE